VRDCPELPLLLPPDLDIGAVPEISDEDDEHFSEISEHSGSPPAKSDDSGCEQRTPLFCVIFYLSAANSGFGGTRIFLSVRRISSAMETAEVSPSRKTAIGSTMPNLVIS